MNIALFLFLLKGMKVTTYKVETGYTIALKFSTQKGGIRAHLVLSLNTINTREVICDHSKGVYEQWNGLLE